MANDLNRCVRDNGKLPLENGARVGFSLIDVGLKGTAGFELTLEGAIVS